MEGRVEELLGRLVDATERNAVANEKIVSLATDERDTGESILGPPFCPHCGTFNPNVRSEGGDGEMAEFALVAQCRNCGNILYGVPQGWLVYKTKEEAAQQIAGKGGTDDIHNG